MVISKLIDETLKDQLADYDRGMELLLKGLEVDEEEQELDRLVTILETISPVADYEVNFCLNIIDLEEELEEDLKKGKISQDVYNKLTKATDWYLSKVFQGDMGYTDHWLEGPRKDIITRGTVRNVGMSINISKAIIDREKKLADKEIDLIKKDVDVTRDAINKLKNLDETEIKVNGIELPTLKKLIKDIPKTVDKTTVAKKFWKFDKLLEAFMPNKVRSTIKELTKDTTIKELKKPVINYVEKQEKGFQSWLNKEKKDMEWLGLVKVKYKDGFVYQDGDHPLYKKNLKDKDFIVKLDKDESVIRELLKGKEDLIKYLNDIPAIADDYERALKVYKKNMDKIKKLYKQDNREFYAILKGCALIANRMRFLALLSHKELKALKWISRKIRLIQTQIKNKAKIKKVKFKP